MTAADTLAPSNSNGISLRKHNTTDDLQGYNANVFPDKQAQMVQVCAHLETTGFIPASFLQNEVSWFYK